MMNLITLYIVPALSAVAGQCRIVARDGSIGSARDSYRRQPDTWREVGVMNSRGKLVCLDEQYQPAWADLKACEPLMGGLQFEVVQGGGLL